MQNIIVQRVFSSTRIAGGSLVGSFKRRFHDLSGPRLSKPPLTIVHLESF